MNEVNQPQISVLVAEDEKFMSNILRVRLEEAGFKVAVANDGNEAWEMLESVQPQVVLLDLIMPNMDGFDFLTKFRAEAKYQHIKVIVTSNLGQDEDRERVLKLGADDYLVKAEVDVDEIVARIKSVTK